MKYKKSELTNLAKDCIYCNNTLLNGICISEDIIGSEIGYKLSHEFTDEGENKELLYELSRRFARYSKNRILPETNNHSVQYFYDLVSKIIRCCEEHNWFE